MSIVIQRSKSSRQHVFLFDLQLEASGTYRCEVQHNQNSDDEECNDDNDERESCFDDGSFVKVSAEAPSFRTKHEEKVVTVLVTSLNSLKTNQEITFE